MLSPKSTLKKLYPALNFTKLPFLYVVDVYNAIGERVIQQALTAGKKNTIYMGALSPGMYLLKDGKGFSAKILKL
jgi:hypothetical protein